MARRDQGIGVGPGVEKPADFKGKTFAVIRTTGADYLLSRFLEKHDLREGTGPDEVKIITGSRRNRFPPSSAAISTASSAGSRGFPSRPDHQGRQGLRLGQRRQPLQSMAVHPAFREDWAKLRTRSSAGARLRQRRPRTIEWTLPATRKRRYDMCVPKKFRLNKQRISPSRSAGVHPRFRHQAFEFYDSLTR